RERAASPPPGDGGGTASRNVPTLRPFLQAGESEIRRAAVLAVYSGIPGSSPVDVADQGLIVIIHCQRVASRVGWHGAPELLVLLMRALDRGGQEALRPLVHDLVVRPPRLKRGWQHGEHRPVH